MMDKKSTACFYTLCFALTLISNNVLALGDSWQNTGTEFLTAFVQNFEDWLEGEEFQLIITALCPTFVHVYIHNKEFSTDVTIEEGQTMTVNIPASVELLGTTNSSTSTVIISSNNPITVLSINYKPETAASAVIFPVEALGTEYYVISPRGSYGTPEFAVINYNQTNDVSINITGPVTYNQIHYKSGEIVHLTLSPFEVVQFQSNDILTGTSIHSKYPVAVLSGNSCDRYNAACDLLYEQLIPVTGWGKNFIIPSLTNRSDSDLVTIITSERTEITFNNGSGIDTLVLLKGESSVILLAPDSYLDIKATRGIMVMLIFTGGVYGSTILDPFMMNIIPVEYFSSSYIINSQSTYDNYILLIADESQISKILIDDQILSDYLIWTNMNMTKYIWTTLMVDVKNESYIIKNCSSCGVYQYGLTSYLSIGTTGSAANLLASISCPVMTTAAIPAPTSISQMVTEKTAESTAPASTSQVATTEFITTRKPPGMIENLTVSNVNDTSFELSWRYPDGDTHLYEIQIDGPQQKAQVSTTESAEIQDLTPGTNYTVRLAAIAFNGRKGPFAEVSHFTNPGRVENISVSNVTTKSIELNWVHPEGNLSSYEIQIEGPQPKVLMADTESAILTDLTSATRYTFNIAAVGGDGTKGDVIEISTFTKPDKIQSISVNNVTTTSAMLTWERPYGDVKSYEIAIQGPESKVITVTTKFANITGLTPGTNYTYKVSPVTEDGTKGEFTAVNKFTFPGTIGSITASNVTMTSLVLSWKHPSGNLKAYEVQIVEIQADIQTTSETVTITKLDPGTTYTVKVAAVADDDTKGAYTITFQPTKKAPPNWCWSRRKPFCCLQPNVKCRSEDNSCFCDSVCPKYSNCCTDYKQHCLDKQY